MSRRRVGTGTGGPPWLAGVDVVWGTLKKKKNHKRWKRALGRAGDSGRGKDTYGKPGCQWRGEQGPRGVETWGRNLQKMLQIEQERARGSPRRQNGELAWQRYPALVSHTAQRQFWWESYSSPRSGQGPRGSQGLSSAADVRSWSGIQAQWHLLTPAEPMLLTWRKRCNWKESTEWRPRVMRVREDNLGSLKERRSQSEGTITQQ